MNSSVYIKKQTLEQLVEGNARLRSAGRKKKPFSIGRWNGKKSVKVRLWRLWLGGSWDKTRHPAAWMIYNGRWLSWRLATWPPRAAVWRA